jgi:V/A-type H+-transporting ATPase subunit G/H
MIPNQPQPRQTPEWVWRGHRQYATLAGIVISADDRGRAMEDTLKRLLDAELRAQALVDQANKERDRMIQQALEEARSADERFTARIPEIQSSFLGKAEERAGQTIGEMTRRYEERRRNLRAMAEGRGGEAVEAALAILLDPDKR